MMKIAELFIAILVVSSVALSATDVYTTVKTKKGTFLSMNSYIAAKGDTATSLQVGNNWTVSGKNTAPATLDFAGFVRGAKIYGSTGSAVDTLVISRMSARMTSQIFDTSLTVILPYGCDIRPELWGKYGKTSIDRAISACPIRGTVIFSDTAYHISSPLATITKEINIDGNNAVIYHDTRLTANTFLFNKTDSISIKNIRFAGKETDSSFTGSTEADIYGAIRLDTCNGVEIENISVSGLRTSIRLQISNTCDIKKVNIQGFFTDTNSSANWAPGLYVFGGSNNTLSLIRSQDHGSIITAGLNTKGLKISHCYGHRLYDNGIYISSGIDCEVSKCLIDSVLGNSCIKVRGTRHTISYNVVKKSVVGLTLTGNGSPDWDSTNGNGLNCIGNIVDSMTGYGITCGSQDGYFPRNIIISDNVITNHFGSAGFSPMSLGVKNGLTVFNNTIDSAIGNYGITVTGGVDTNLTYGVNISTNRLSRIAGKGLYVDHCRGAVISGNIFDKIQSYSIEGRYLTGSVISNNTNKIISDGILTLPTAYASDSNAIINNVGLQNIAESKSALLMLKYNASSINTKLSMTDTTSAASSTTGALVVSGGAGFAKDVFLSGKTKFTDSTKTPTIKDSAGKYWRIKVSSTGTLSADSTGQN
jgi:hypothetical protein